MVKQEDCGTDSQYKKQDPISKITRAKMVGGMAQVVQCLPSKYEALNSNPSTSKKNFFQGRKQDHVHAAFLKSRSHGSVKY
jgi:hypothetical protein